MFRSLGLIRLMDSTQEVPGGACPPFILIPIEFRFWAWVVILTLIVVVVVLVIVIVRVLVLVGFGSWEIPVMRCLAFGFKLLHITRDSEAAMVAVQRPGSTLISCGSHPGVWATFGIGSSGLQMSQAAKSAT